MEAELRPITELLAGLEPNVPRRMRLTIATGDGKPTYITTFHVLRETYTSRVTGTIKESFSTLNKCITVAASEDTYIQANSPEKACFEPLLVSEPVGTPDRNTSTDILQVIKTKLLLAQPRRNPESIGLSDAATIKDVFVSAFNLLRGKHAIYEKYGYENPTIPAIQAAIAATRWADVAAAPFHKGATFGSAYTEMIGTTPAPETPISEALAPLSLDTEADYIRRHVAPKQGLYLLDLPFSHKVLDTILKRAGLKYPHAYVLNPYSRAWQYWAERIKIIRVELLDADPDANSMPNMEGGHRRGHRRGHCRGHRITRGRSLRNRRTHLTRFRVREQGGRRGGPSRAQTARRAR